MTRDEKIAKARELRERCDPETGFPMSYHEIGERLGVTHSCVIKWLNPERARLARKADNARRGPAKRAWDNAHRASCVRCGQTMGPASSIPSKQNTGLCLSCVRDDRRAQGHATATRLVELWAAGKTMAEIAGALGWTVNTLGSMMAFYRERGYDLPYRRTGDALENIRRANSNRVAA